MFTKSDSQPSGVVELNPVLTIDERKLLAVSDKKLVTSHRNSLHALSTTVRHNEGQTFSHRVDQLGSIWSKIIAELQTVCTKFIALITNKILPATTDHETQVFFER
jgi:14-3-3 protein epsilon